MAVRPKIVKLIDKYNQKKGKLNYKWSLRSAAYDYTSRACHYERNIRESPRHV